MSAETIERKPVCIPEIETLMGQGYTRYPSSKGYDAEIGSIQEFYGLTSGEAKLLFTHDDLKSLKTKVPKPVVEDIFNFVDTPTGGTEEDTPESTGDVSTGDQDGENSTDVESSGDSDDTAWEATSETQSPAVVADDTVS